MVDNALIKIQATAKKDHAKDSNEKYERSSRHLEYRNRSIQKANVHQLEAVNSASLLHEDFTHSSPKDITDGWKPKEEKWPPFEDFLFKFDIAHRFIERKLN